MGKGQMMLSATLIVVIFAQTALSDGETYCLDSYAGNRTQDDFVTWTCSNCLTLLSYPKKLPVYTHISLGPNLILKTNRSVQYTPTVNYPPNAEVCENYISKDDCRQWYECCVAAKQCCKVQQQQQELVQKEDNIKYCPALWDGVDCWSAAKESTISRKQCPSYFSEDNLESSNPTSNKICLPGGRWYSRPDGRTWTNYTDCFKKKDQTDLLLASIYVSFAFNIFSLASLVIAVALYAVFRSYLRRDEKGRCKFNMNINLFIAFILMGLSTIIYEPIYYLDAIKNLGDNRLEENTIECRALKVLIWYFRSATYWWLFCEGLYLRNVLINPMGSNRSTLKHIIIGWGVPIPPTIAWMVARVMTANERCWSSSSTDLEYIVMVPNLLALLLNLILLITVQVELMRHFADTNDDDVIDLVRQGIKVTFSLVPVFGVQIIVLSYRPENWIPYDIIANIVIGIQGFLVALMYCFVTKEIRIAYQRFKRHTRISISISSSKGTKSSRLSSSLAGFSSGRNDSVPNSHPMQEIEETARNEPRNSSVWSTQEAQSVGHQDMVIAL